MNDIIKYGMGRDYLPDWTYQDALREIYQNFRDFGVFDEKVKSPEGVGDRYVVSLSNDFVPNGYDFLRIGKSLKRDDSSTVGKHGEGLKMAAMVLRRNKCAFNVLTIGEDNFGENIFGATFYDDEFLGECFGFSRRSFSELGEGTGKGFEIQFSVPKEEFDRYHVIQLSDEDVIHETSYGQLLKKPAGEVYVGGHFVAVMDSLKYAYDFKPEHVPLDRDRKVPSAFDVNWAAAQILGSWEGLTVKDMGETDTQYMSSIPLEIAKKFKPSLFKGEVVFRAGAVQAPPNAVCSLMAMPVNQKRIAKMKYSMSKKRTPHSILKEFFDAHGRRLPADVKVDLQVLLKKAKNWK